THGISFSGGADDDTFISSNALGSDAFDGGLGVDTVDYHVVSGPVVVNLTAGTATGNAGADSVLNVENVIGTAADDIFTGKAGVANSLTGGDGIDTVNYAGETGGGAVTVNLSSAVYGSLNPGQATDTGNATDTLSGVENVIASNGTYGDTVVLDGDLDS